MHVFPSLPPRRIAGCLEGPELEAARAEWHALDKTDEREAMICDAPRPQPCNESLSAASRG